MPNRLIGLVFAALVAVSGCATPDSPAESGDPVAGTARKPSTERVVIVVDKNNTISIKGKVLTLDQLREALRPLAGKKLKQPILIAADQGVEWETVESIVQVANELKFWRISFRALRRDVSGGE